MKTLTKIVLTVALVGTFGLSGLIQIVSAKQTSAKGAEMSQNHSSSKTSVLKIGSKGTAVTEAQKYLQKEGFYKGAINGIFGSEMKSAVMAFQKSEHIKPNGIIDSATRVAID